MLETQLCWKWSNSEAEQTNGGHNQVGEVEIRKMIVLTQNFLLRPYFLVKGLHLIKMKEPRRERLYLDHLNEKVQL